MTVVHPPRRLGLAAAALVTLLLVALVLALALVPLVAEQAPAPGAAPAAQAPRPRGPQSLPPFRKHILVIGATRGYQHDSVTPAMGAVWQLGRETGMWEALLRTDYQLLTRKKLQGNAKNIDTFDAIVFANSTGEMDLDDEQKQALLSFVRDEGKGVVGIHAALDANYKWPEYGEMMGGWFDAHPWNTFDAPIVVEDAEFPAVRHFPRAFMKRDEIYQARAWSRDTVNVLLRLDETKLNYENNPNIRRDDRDFAVAWAKMYGKGRVFYSTLGHTQEAWNDPDVTQMYFEAIKWVLGLTEGSTASHPRPSGS